MPPRSRLFRSARGALVILTLINLLNYLDRYVVSALVESLRRSELHLSDLQLGSLVTAFVVVYMAASPVFGVLGDRRRRPPLLGIGIAIWSVATAAGGLARGFVSLFSARAAVGVGEASYGAIAPALLADAFPAERRGRVFAVFFCAIPIGSALGYVLGGWMDQRFGWRAAFLLAGAPGLVLAFLAARLADPPRRDDRGAAAAPETGEPSALARFAAIARIGPYRRAVLGYAAYTFALGALAFWTPAFLERVRGVPRSQATILFGAIAVGTGFVGTFAGGWIGDRLLRRSAHAYLWVSGIATLLAAPAALVAFTSESRSVYVAAIVVSETLLFVSTGPINSAIVNAVPADRRASAIALSTFAIHLFGDVPSPPLLGAISDATSLATAFLLVPAVIAVAGIIWIWAAVKG
jgi:MFS family permease